MIKGIKHIGLAVDNLAEAGQFFEDTFGLTVGDRESFGELLFSMVPLPGSHLELLQSTTADGQMARFIEKRGTGVHHIAFEVDDIQAELNGLKAKGLRLINEKPYLNAHQDLVAFLHPKSTYGILIELIQPGPHRDQA